MSARAPSFLHFGERANSIDIKIEEPYPPGWEQDLALAILILGTESWWGGGGAGAGTRHHS